MVIRSSVITVTANASSYKLKLPPATALPCSPSPPHLRGGHRWISSSPSFRSPHSQSHARTSVHPSEVAHFTRLSSTWWDPNGELALLHKMNKGRIAFLRDKVVESNGYDRALQQQQQRLARSRDTTAATAPTNAQSLRANQEQERELDRQWCKGMRVIDVGCGGGLLSESLARLGATVHGIDATGTNIAIAQHHASVDPFFSTPQNPPFATPIPIPRLTYSHITAEDLLSSPNGEHKEGYDLVASVEVLEHVSSPSSFLHSLSSLLKPGGHLLLSTIARTPLARLLTITMAEEVLGLVSKGTHSYEKFISSSELKKFIASEEDGGLGWYPSARSPPAPSTTTVSNEGKSHDAFAPLDQSSSSSMLPARLQMETRGILYDPVIGDWRLLDRSSWLQRNGLGEECNYLLWARKPLL